MADFMEVVQNRRSIRRYESKEIPEETMQQVLDAIRWSPSWANTQCWEIVLAKDPEVKKNLQATISDRNPSTNAMVDAPVVVVLCGKLKSAGYYKGTVPTKFGDWFMFDLGIACQTLCLTAHAVGLGTVVVGLFDHDKVKEIVNLPEDYEAVVMIPMGYSDQLVSAPQRKEIVEFCHENAFKSEK